MYRVIQVSEGQLDGQTEGTGAISGYPATQSMTHVPEVACEFSLYNRNAILSAPTLQGKFTSGEAGNKAQFSLAVN